jgi:hypothetical protein
VPEMQFSLGECIVFLNCRVRSGSEWISLGESSVFRLKERNAGSGETIRLRRNAGRLRRRLAMDEHAVAVHENKFCNLFQAARCFRQNTPA